MHYKTTTVQVKTNTLQDIPIWNSHNIIKYPQYKVNGTFIHKDFTVIHFASLYPQQLHRKSLHSLHFITHFTSLRTSLHFTSLAVDQPKLSTILLVQTFGLSLRGVEYAIATPVSTFSPSFNNLHKFILLTRVASATLFCAFERGIVIPTSDSVFMNLYTL